MNVTTTRRGAEEILHPVQSVAWSPDGELLVSGGDDQTLRIWDAASGITLATLLGHEDSVLAVDWKHDGRHVASGGAGNRVRIWDAASGLLIRTLQLRDSIWSLSWSANGQWLAAGHGTANAGPEVTLWATRTWRRTQDIADSPEEAWSVAWSPDSSLLLFGSGLRKVKLFDMSRLEVTADLAGHKDEVLAVTWDPVDERKRFATAGEDRSIRIWDARAEQALTSFRAHRGHVRALDWSPDGKRLASGGAEGTVKLWDADRTGDANITRRFPNWVSAVDWHPNNRWLATAHLQNTATIWDTDTGADVSRLIGHTNRIWDIAFSPDGSKVATASYDHTVRVWSVEGQLLRTLSGHERTAENVEWSPDGIQLSCVYSDGVAIVWDAATGEELRRRPNMSSRDGLKWSPNGGILAGILSDFSVGIFDASSGELTRTLPIATSRSLGWSRGGDALAVGGHDGWLQVWSLRTHGWRYRVHAHDQPILRVAWNPTGDRIVTASDDGTARLHESGSGLELLRLYDAGDPVRTVAWSPDGNRIAAGTWGDNFVRVWNVAKGYTGSSEALDLELDGVERAESRIRAGDLAAAVEFAERMAAVGRGRPELLRNAVHVLAEAATAAEEDDAKNTYERRAVEVLRELLVLQPECIRELDEGQRLFPLTRSKSYDRLLADFGITPLTELVPLGSSWNYLDAGPYPPEDWINREFDDAAWKSGPAQLGYGDGDEATIVGFGESAKQKRATTHLRIHFQAESTATIASLVLGLLVDDGAAVYLNGTEIVRWNLRAAAAAQDFALSQVDKRTESDVHYLHGIDAGALTEGENVLAVEIHQSSGGSSDLSFDLRLACVIESDRGSTALGRDNPLRLELIRRLGQASVAYSRVVPLLISMLSEDEANARAEAARALGKLGSRAEQALAALFRGLGDEDVVVRDACAGALAQFAPDAPGMEEALSASLRSELSRMRAGACRVAATLGEVPTTELETLRERAADEDPATRYWATVAMSQFDSTLAMRISPLREGDDARANRERHRAVLFASQKCGTILLRAQETPPAADEEDLRRALGLARAAAALEPGNATLLHAIGLALHLLGRKTEAVEELEAAHAIQHEHDDGGQERTLDLLARIHGELGNEEQARGFQLEANRLYFERQAPSVFAHQLHVLGAWEQHARGKEVTAADFSALDLEEEQARAQAALVVNRLDSLIDLDLSGTSIDDQFLPALESLSKLKRLSLRETEISSQGLAALKDLETLRALDLSGTRVDDDAMTAVARLKSLETIFVARTRVTNRGLERLACLPNLSMIDLEGTDVSDEGLRQLASCARLRVVRAGSTRITDDGATGLEHAVPGVRVMRNERVARRVASSPGVDNLHPPMKPSIHALDDLRAPGLLQEDVLAFADSNHQLNGVSPEGLPPFLVGAELVRNASSQKSLPGFTLTITTTRACDLYLLIDNRVGDGNSEDPPTLENGIMGWVETMGFVRTEYEVGFDETSSWQELGLGPGASIDQRATVFALKGVAPGRHTFHEQNAGNGMNIYALAVVPAE